MKEPCHRCGWPTFLFERRCHVCGWDRWNSTHGGSASDWETFDRLTAK